MSSRPDAFMPLWIGDYLADTTHLNTEQHGTYLLLLMAYWRRGGPLPADDHFLSRHARMTMYKWKALRPIVAAFFSEVDGLWVNKRADEELAKAERKYKNLAAAGRKGAETRKINHSRAKYVPPITLQNRAELGQLAASSPNPTGDTEAAAHETAENSHINDSVATALPVAKTKQSQSQSQASKVSTSEPYPETQNQDSSLLVSQKSETRPPAVSVPVVSEFEQLLRPASKPISSKRERGTRWPAGQAVPGDWIAAAAARRAERGLPVIDLALEAEKFTNYWTAKSGQAATKVDWAATWRMWSLNAYGANSNGRDTRAGQPGNVKSGFLTAIERELAEIEAAERASRH